MIVQHNLQSINAVRQFNINNSSKAKSVEKLSSGFRVNRAADDASGLAISEKMRRQIRGLDRAAENIQDGVSLCNVADGALNEVHDIFQRERKLLIQAANDTNSFDDREYLQQEINALGKELDRIFDTTDFNGIYLFKGHDSWIDGPHIKDDTYSDSSSVTEIREQTKNITWVDKDYVPPPDQIDPPQLESLTVTITQHSEQETTGATDERGHNAVEIDRTDTTEITVEAVTSQHSITYQKASDTITDLDLISELSLQKPDRAIGNNGYVNMLQNDAGTLSLSCAMSQLGLRIKDPSTGAYVFNDISIYGRGSTTYDTVNNTATTTYNITPDIKLKQIVSTLDTNLINGTAGKDKVIDGYNLSYVLENTSSIPYEIEMRMAFDTMNTTASEHIDAGHKYTLSDATASITVQGSGNIDRSLLTDIGKVYGNWDYNMGATPIPNFSHTGATFWYKATATPNDTTSIGSVEYGHVTYNKVPLKYDNKIEYTIDSAVNTLVRHTTGVIMPTYLDIQAGADAWQTIPIRLWDLSTESLGMLAGLDVNAHHAAESLENIDNAFEKINNIRSYYGAMTNRLEHAYNINKNVEENTQAAESKIRDTDMATEITKLSNAETISQAGMQMISQANQTQQNVLKLLNQ